MSSPVFVDSCVVLRWLLGEPDPLDLDRDVAMYASVLLRVETKRTLHRMRMEGKLSELELRNGLRWLNQQVPQYNWIEVTETLIESAGNPMAFVIKSLDALQLVSALALRDALGSSVVFATHDKPLAQKARRHGFTVVGC